MPIRSFIHRCLPLLLLFCLGGFTGCDSAPETPATPLIRVNGLEIAKPEFLQQFRRTLQPDQQLSASETQDLQRTFLIQLIDRELIATEAKRLGVAVTPEELAQAVEHYRGDYPDGEFEENLKQRGLTLADWRGELEDGLVMEKLLEEAVYSRIEVSEMELAAYYETHREEFDRPAQVRARQIVVADEATGRQVLGLLQQGRPFAEVAREHSLSPDGQEGGDLGFFGRDQMPQEFDDVVFNLKVGRLSELVKSEYGYHIFLVEEKRSAKRLSKKEAADEIRQILERQKREEVYQQWLQELRAKAVIEIDWAQLDAAAAQ